MSCWLVGEAPERTAVDRPHLWLRPDLTEARHCANRLLEIAGYSTTEYLRVFVHRTYLWRDPDDIQLFAGRMRALSLLEESKGSRIIVLGSRVAAAFCLDMSRPLKWQGRLAFVPYPSKFCLFWDDHRNRARAAEFFRALLACTIATTPTRSST